MGYNNTKVTTFDITR